MTPAPDEGARQAPPPPTGQETISAAGDHARTGVLRFPPRLPHSTARARPGNLTHAIGLEADATCAWLCLASLRLAWNSLAGGPEPIAVIPLALAAACAILWPTLKRAAQR